MGNFLQVLKKAIKNKKGRIAFPESIDSRILQAINELLADQTVFEIYLFARREEILNQAKKENCLALLKYEKQLLCVGEDFKISKKALKLFLKENMKHKPLSDEALDELCLSPLYMAGYLLAQGKVDCVLAGVLTETSHVIRAALRTVGKAEGVQTVSGSFIMQRDEEIYLYADCGVNIEPSLDELVDIAMESQKTWKALPMLNQRQAHMAFLSFSTKGSAKHKLCLKMEKAASLVKERDPNVIVDGELQFDAAIDLEIGKRKAPGSPVAGKANIFIFPDLNAGNIAYKITQRLGGFSAYGPILQGLKKPYCDLSRGATVHDIVVCAYINLLR